MKSPESSIQVEESGPGTFTLTVTFGGQRFACGNYLSRVAAMQAGRLFVQRKEGESGGRRERGRRKPEKG